MRLKNTTLKTSATASRFLGSICLVMTVGLILFYKFTNPEVSFWGFFQFLGMLIQAMWNLEEDRFLLLGLFVGTPVVLYVSFIWSVVSRYFAIQEFDSGLNLKYIDFLPGRASFCFTKPQYNFECAYEDIEKLNMIINTVVVYTKYGSSIKYGHMTLDFTLLNGKKFSLTHYPAVFVPMKIIYSIIDYTRSVKKFSYKFSGAGEVPDIREKIEKYIHYGFKDMLGRNDENLFKYLSIMLFAVGIAIIWPFLGDIAKDPFLITMLSPIFIMILVSFILDVVLIVDKMREKHG